MSNADNCRTARWLFLPLLVVPLSLWAQVAPQARVVVVGSADVALYGQDGYCGSMDSYDKSNTVGVLISAGKRTWFRLKHKRACVGDFSFVPEPGQAYILRAGTTSTPCVAEFFRVNPGRQPTREHLHTEEKRSCLLPWNHDWTQESSPTTPSSNAAN
jgi:hypothetical protein